MTDADDLILRTAVAEFCYKRRSRLAIKRNFASDPDSAMRVVYWMLCNGRMKYADGEYRVIRVTTDALPNLQA